jgi:ethanolamine ammonia-lyase small subunit
MSEMAHCNSIAAQLRALTTARVGLGRTGVSQQTRDLLDFQLAHAQARDAVHARLEAAALVANLTGIVDGLVHPHAGVLRLHSAAPDRTTYLQRPDLGRNLDEPGRASLAQLSGKGELALIVADGLSALAVERHVPPLFKALLPCLQGWRLTPVCVVEQGRVAIGDEIGLALGAKISVVLIGERPGLSSPDSLGAYITWAPRPGRTDAERNCISNIRAEGLSYVKAASQLSFYLTESRRRQLSGVKLKEEANLLKEG